MKKITIKAKDMEAVSKDPLLQGTNGVLTMSFIVMLVLCTAGYLIYWIMSIRAREMVFGVLRACGMHKGEIFKMLFMEQVFFRRVCSICGNRNWKNDICHVCADAAAHVCSGKSDSADADYL